MFSSFLDSLSPVRARWNVWCLQRVDKKVKMKFAHLLLLLLLLLLLHVHCCCMCIDAYLVPARMAVATLCCTSMVDIYSTHLHFLQKKSEKYPKVWFFEKNICDWSKLCLNWLCCTYVWRIEAVQHYLYCNHIGGTGVRYPCIALSTNFCCIYANIHIYIYKYIHCTGLGTGVCWAERLQWLLLACRRNLFKGCSRNPITGCSTPPSLPCFANYMNFKFPSQYIIWFA